MRQIPTTGRRPRRATTRRASAHRPHLLCASALVLCGLVALLAPAGPSPRLAHAAPRSPVVRAPAPIFVTSARTPHAGPTSCRAVYIVRPGDWLSMIAPRVRTTWPALAAANHLADPDLIVPGQRLCVPAPSRHVTATPAAPAQRSQHTGAGVAGHSAPSQRVTRGVSWVMRPGEPCYGRDPMSAFNVARVSQYSVPAGCFAGVYREPTSVGGYRPLVAWGQCSSFPSMLHRVPWPSAAGRYHTTPRAGAIVYWTPRMNHAPFAHYAELVAVRADGWMLVSEVNMSWRGGGFGRVLYQFIPPTRGLWYIY